MKKTLSILLLLIPITAFSQDEKENYKMASANFETKYNAKDFKGIFNLFAPEMQKALPLEKTEEFFTGLFELAGKITGREFQNFEQERVAMYKTNFQKGVFMLNFVVNDNNKISGFLVKPFIEETENRNKTALQLPFEGEWFVFWGGDTVAENYHAEYGSQKNAFDFVVTDVSGKTYKNQGKQNEDYFAFGKKLLAPSDAEVILSVDGVKDNIPGTMNPAFTFGNAVILKTATNEYLVLAHFKQNSIIVKQGQKVKKGELLGLAGNSGNSSEPHLHFHVQDSENVNTAKPIKAYFDNILVNGEPKKEHSPVKGEKISNK